MLWSGSLRIKLQVTCSSKRIQKEANRNEANVPVTVDSKQIAGTSVGEVSRPAPTQPIPEAGGEKPGNFQVGGRGCG